MTISSSLSFGLYQPLSTQKATIANYDTVLAISTNYQQPQKPTLQETTTNSKATEVNMVEQYAYAPNISAMFNAYLEKQRLNSSLDVKTEVATQRLVGNGMEKKQAEQYAKTSVDVYKQILESQLNSKIAGQVEQQKEFKQKTDSTASANPYVQMTGSLVNLYS